MKSLAELLIAEERRDPSNPAGHHHAAFRVCEKLRAPLVNFAGVAGYRSLLSRALTLARAEAPLLEGLEITGDGTLRFSTELEPRLATDEGARAGAALADQLLGLLVVFIGEALTLRLVHDVWPMVADSKQNPKRE